jgi:ubiquinone/menaquinone biosynthesis C-methylase UbiE
VNNKGRNRILFLPRTPEPEIMGSTEEAEIYSSAAAQAYLEKVDATFVAHALNLGVKQGLVLDVGTGPGQIPIKLALRNPRLQIMGIDLSEAMLVKARKNAELAGVLGRVTFQVGDAKHTLLPSRHFDLVICNSLLHHAADPLATLNEIARVAKPEGALLLRDLRRPSALAFPIHIRWFGRNYSGLMKKLYTDSVRAAYTSGELGELLDRSEISGGHFFRKGFTHIGIERRVGSL